MSLKDMSKEMGKKTGGMTQVVEHLPNKYEALSSNHKTTQNNYSF
jgi:hypothetical protein